MVVNGIEVKRRSMERSIRRIRGLMEVFDQEESMFKFEVKASYSTLSGYKRSVVCGAMLEVNAKESTELLERKILWLQDKLVTLITESIPQYVHPTRVSNLELDFHIHY